MQFDRWNIHSQQTHVLNNDSIHACGIKFSDKALHLCNFIIIHKGVYSDIYLCAEFMGKTNDFRNILDGICRTFPGTMA